MHTVLFYEISFEFVCDTMNDDNHNIIYIVQITHSYLYCFFLTINQFLSKYNFKLHQVLKKNRIIKK